MHPRTNPLAFPRALALILASWAATQGQGRADAAFISYSGTYTYTGPPVIGMPGGGPPRVVLQAGDSFRISVGFDLTRSTTTEVAPGVYDFRFSDGFLAGFASREVGATNQFGASSTLRVVLDADGIGGSIRFSAYGGTPAQSVDVWFNDPDGLVITSLTPPADLSDLALLGGSFYGWPYRYFPEFSGSFPPAIVPEPAGFAMLTMGGAGLLMGWRRRVTER